MTDFLFPSYKQTTNDMNFPFVVSAAKHKPKNMLVNKTTGPAIVNNSDN